MTGLFGVVVAILTWDQLQITPVPGLDASWVLGLNMASAQGLDHGTEFAFTYGPLGFLEQPMVIAGLQASLAGIYLVAIRAALAASLLWAARRSFSWPAAAALALVLATIVPRSVGSVPLALTILWSLIALQRAAPPWTARVVVLGGGALAALETMIKLNVGITVLVMVAVTVIALRGRRLRNLGELGAGFAVAFAILWFAAGQGVGNLDDYVRSSVEIVSGYERSMQLESGAVAWDWAAAGVVALATLAVVVYTGARERLAARIAMPVLVGLLAFSLFKYGFVRHDAGHVAALFGVLAVVWVTPRWEGAGRALACAAVAIIAIAYFPAADESLDSSFQPGVAIDQLRQLEIPGERQSAGDEARLAMQAAYAVDPRMIERIGGSPVDARPWEVGLIWAYDLNWRPLPVIQDYTAYAPGLDRLNAEALAADDGPRYVLRHLGYGNSSLIGLDGRLTTFDAPLETRALLCDFGPALTTPAYQLLERGPDRCGAERPLGSVDAAYGEPVAIPRAGRGEAVLARIDGAGGEGIERLRTLAYREAIREISLGPTVTRFQTPTASDGILLSVPRSDDFPAPFALGLDQPTISIDSEGGFATSRPTLRYEFFAVPIEPPASVPG